MNATEASPPSLSAAFARRRRLGRIDVALAAGLALLVLAGHWKLLLLNHQPVGGDKASFFYGLMAHYGERLKAGELPWWCPIWGEGFPMIAESQVGAFYPPHLVLYRFLPALDAFRWDFLLHRLALGPSVFFAMRHLGLGRVGAWVAGLAITLGGFPVNHYDHQWAVCSLPWLPWLPALAWRLLTRPRASAAIALPPVLGMVLLVGHFQTTFMTLVAVTLLIVGRCLWGLRGSARWIAPVRGLMVLLLIAIGFMLAGIQLAPTAWFIRDVRMLGSTMDRPDFRATHAQPVWMQTALFAPALHFREPFWRAPWWTAQRTAPEECLHYVGLLPAALALGTLPLARRRAFVWCWWLVWVAAINFGAGRWLLWNHLLESLPGFGWFRCPARWILIQQFAAAALAGYAADRIRSVTTLRRVAGRALLASLFVFTLWGSLWGVAYGFAPSRAAARVVAPREFGWELMTGFLDEAMFAAGDRVSVNPYTARSWRELGFDPDRVRDLVVALPNIALAEVGPTILVGVLSLLIAGLILRGSPGADPARRRRRVMLTLTGLVTADLALFQTMFPDRSIAREALVPTGKLAESLAALPPGSRVLAPGGNFLMSMGLAPVESYRTVDLMISPLLREARWPVPGPFAQPRPNEKLLLSAGGSIAALVDNYRGGGTIIPGSVEWLDAWLFGVTEASDPSTLESVGTKDRMLQFVPSPEPGIGGFFLADGLYAALPDPKDPEVLEINWSNEALLKSIENTVSSVRWSGNRLRVEFEGRHGVLVLAAPALPGWEPQDARSIPFHARLRNSKYDAGVRLTRFERGWLAFESRDWPQGQPVEFVYRAPGAMAGLVLSALGIMFQVIAMIAAFLRDPHWRDFA